MKRQWYLGFLGLLALLGVGPALEGEWQGALWLVWVVWFVYFIPRKSR